MELYPLYQMLVKKYLLDRIEEKFIEKGFSMAQYSSFDSVLGRDLNHISTITSLKIFQIISTCLCICQKHHLYGILPAARSRDLIVIS